MNLFQVYKKIFIICAVLVTVIAVVSPTASYAGWEELGKVLGIPAKTKREMLTPGKPRILANRQQYQIIDMRCSYRKAKLYAASVGGHLAIINSRRESKMLYEFMRSQGYDIAYFGAVDTDNNGRWTDPDGNKLNFTFWDDGEPETGKGYNFYAMLHNRSRDGSWRAGDWSLNDKSGAAFIIEWDKIHPIVEETKVTNTYHEPSFIEEEEIITG